VTPVPAARANLDAIIAVDGASKGNPGPAGAGVVVMAPEGDVLRELSIPIPHATNNVAEYTGLLKGLEAARELGLRRIEVRTDSELMVRQLSGEYRVKNPGLQRLHAQVAQLIDRFESCRVRHVMREKNVLADRLASAAAREAGKGPERKPAQGSLDL
jgi:ribonuclease HI